MLFSFKVQICLLSSVEFFRLLFLNDCLWFPYLILNGVSVKPIYVSSFSIDLSGAGWVAITVAWYIIPDCWHFPSNGQLFLLRQLHISGVLVGFSNLDLLCWSILFLTLGMQLYDSLRVFLLKIGLRMWSSGKLSATILKNLWPILVLTCVSNGGLNHVMLRFRFFLLLLLGGVGEYFSSNLCPLLFKAC